MSETSIHEFDLELICDYFLMLERQGPGSPEATLAALSFIAARDNEGAVWSNDKRLRRMRKESGVCVYWGLEMLLVLMKNGHLSKARAKKAATRIHEVDKHHITTSRRHQKLSDRLRVYDQL